MRYSSARAAPRHDASAHEVRLLWIGLAFSVLAVGPLIAGNVGGEWTAFCSGAAGAATIQYAWSESRSSRPLTLGHQLVLWWYWVFALPLFALATRKQRPTMLTILLIAPIAIVFAGTIVAGILEIWPFLG